MQKDKYYHFNFQKRNRTSEGGESLEKVGYSFSETHSISSSSSLHSPYPIYPNYFQLPS